MKKLSISAGILLLLAAIGYFFIYPYDYIVRFEAPTFPGAVNQSIKFWNREIVSNASDVRQEDLFHLQQQIRSGDTLLNCNWEIEPLTDSTSLVRAKFRDPDNSLANKWDVLTGNSAVARLSKKLVRDFAEHLQSHSEEFRVSIVGESELPSTFYAYVPVRSTQYGKAAGMMANYNMLGEVLTSNEVALNGPPMIVVNKWDRETDSLDYNFCFPIIRSSTLPDHPLVKYKRIFPERALKAVYNGNYITSDRAWYALLDYADKNGIEVEPEPVEVFFNNPNMGGNALTWKAEIYLPIKGDEPSAAP